MQKSEAIELLGGTVTAAAQALGISYQAVDKWPEELPDRIAQRVLGVVALQRYGDKLLPELKKRKDAPKSKTVEV